MLSFAVLALAAFASSANALVVPRSTPPPGYAVGYLEDYTTYHTRYLALNCQGQHGTSFFDDCCHPMLATENLQANRKPYCTPSASASSSAAQAEPTSTVEPSGDPGCDDDTSSSADVSASSAAPPPPPASSPSPTSSDPTSSAPPPTSSSAPPQNQAAKPSTSSPAASPSPSPSNNDGGSSGLSDVIGQIMQGGIATFFFQNGIAGNCGQVHSDSDLIVALETSTYAGGIHCGKQIQIQDAKTGHTAVGTVADSCPTCINDKSIDLSQGLFNQFASAQDGTFDVVWGFMN
ncbi:hypothetical protein JB92DRAFT_3083789 [Gautieria morchelliformis]|nr:hypothetical protein JB92DRAFT_3083789 [Gautieria morchelliformis]